MDWLEQKYVGLLSSRLRNFKRKSNSLYNFSCPICGDSTSHKSKARGYIYEKKGKSSFHCHNCGATMTVPNFIKTLDQPLYNQYMMEKLQGKEDPKKVDFDAFVSKMKKPEFIKSTPLNKLKKISQLSPEHPAKQFIDKRKIPTPYHAKLFYCPNFKHFTNELIPGKFENEDIDEARILIPFINESKKLHAYQGRAIGKHEAKVKYITIVLDDEVPKIYGLDTVNFDKRTYIMEGPLDSIFIPNSIATAGGDLVTALGDLEIRSVAVVVYDNEPRSKETVKKLDKAIMQGYNVCIWPENLEHKDINDMILAGLSPEFIRYIIDKNTHRDLAAKLALTKWSKV